MKKMVAVVLMLLMVFATCAAIAAPEATLTSRVATNNCIGSENGTFFEYFIWKDDLEKVSYIEITNKITDWDGVYFIGTAEGLIGRIWAADDVGVLIKDKQKTELSAALNQAGEVYSNYVLQGYSTTEVDFYGNVKPVRVIQIDGEANYRLVIVQRPVPEEAKEGPVPTPAPTKAPTKKPTKKPTKAPTATPKPTPHPHLNETTNTATPKPTPVPQINDTTNTATPKPTPVPQVNDTEQGGKVTPRPVVVDPNPTLSPEDDAKLDFVDIPVENPSDRNTPRPVLVDPNPTLSPEDDAKLDFEDIPVGGTPVHEVTPEPPVTTEEPETTKKPLPNPGLSDANPELDNGQSNGLDFD